MTPQDAQQRDPQGEFLFHILYRKIVSSYMNIYLKIQMKKQKQLDMISRARRHQLKISNANQLISRKRRTIRKRIRSPDKRLVFQDHTTLIYRIFFYSFLNLKQYNIELKYTNARYL